MTETWTGSCTGCAVQQLHELCKPEMAMMHLDHTLRLMLVYEELHLLHQHPGVGELRERVEMVDGVRVLDHSRTGFPFARSFSTYLACQSLKRSNPPMTMLIGTTGMSVGKTGV
jgi:hypothetical protein